eukprot:6181458-Pleurochrysis_carterae.AAC.4
MRKRKKQAWRAKPNKRCRNSDCRELRGYSHIPYFTIAFPVGLSVLYVPVPGLLCIQAAQTGTNG